MTQRRIITVDGNEAAASVAYRTNEIVAIYPITPSSAMGELSDEWAVRGKANIWGVIPDVVEMQSEGGAAGAVHGSLQAGGMTTTFTASQGLLLMIPNLYKIAGELTSAVLHVASRSIATHALSIFGDHSDIYACRQTGFALLASNNAQEAHDLACISQAATLKSRIPLIHFFDGFRTSHTIEKIEELTDHDLRSLIDDDLVREHKKRALSPDHPVVRGTAQNPDTFFQAREAINRYYDMCPGIVQGEMERFADRTGRSYNLFEYVGDPQADRVIVIMGSGADAVHESVEWLNSQGEKVGVVKVRLYRPFASRYFLEALPPTVRTLAVLDRTKEPGSTGEPLYLDVLTALVEARADGNSPLESEPRILGGRYGLSSKEFNSAMVKAIFDEMAAEKPKNHFTTGIRDDITHTSLDYDPQLDIEPDDVFRGIFFGLGSDGTVGANKNTIRIIGEQTDYFAQGYFVFDSKKAGAITISHLRFSKRPIRSSYLIRRARFVACHQWMFLDKYDILKYAEKGAVFLLNSGFSTDRVWHNLPREVQHAIIEKELQFYVIDAYRVASEAGLGRRINSIMQTCFFAISGVLPRDEAIDRIKDAVRTSYGKKGQEIVRMNFAAIDNTLANLHRIDVPQTVDATRARPAIVQNNAPDFVQRVTAMMMAGDGDLLPVSAFPPDGTWPSGTAMWEKRNLAPEIPIWDPDICIQCNKCAIVCPHAAIRTAVYPVEALSGAPESFVGVDYTGKEFPDWKYTVQVAPEDCTGCTLCVDVCPARDKSNPSHKAINMEPQLPVREREQVNYDFFLSLPELDRTKVKVDVKGSQFHKPLFEYSGACAGCGETPYIKLMTQLYGERLLIANATGCSSIYGGNLPTTPYTVNADGRGPAWSNSLFEDNAEFGLGFRLAVDKNADAARYLLNQLSVEAGEELVREILDSRQRTEEELRRQRDLIERLLERVRTIERPEARRLESLIQYLIRKTVWIVGGDGWAYDIGYGGLDHVLAMNRDVNVLVLDTGVYSNTGGQASKATPLGATAKFAMGGKSMPRKDLGLMAMAYGHIYVAQICMGARDTQTVRAFEEAESYPGSSLIIAYSPCIAHGYDLAHSLEHSKLAVDTGFWPLYRYDPRRVEEGKNPLIVDSRPPSIPFAKYAEREARFRILMHANPERSRQLISKAQEEIGSRDNFYRQMAQMAQEAGGNGVAGKSPPPSPARKSPKLPPGMKR